ncbi:Lachesin [Melipona quadrifasciata]|uniref:Lachesin n=1 Tax=Melipona quadrifasciata TaxID=166423 RepID=A0A0N0U3N3_9HYME|nr:Lachesin [Melipona quadrifasciata]
MGGDASPLRTEKTEPQNREHADDRHSQPRMTVVKAVWSRKNTESKIQQIYGLRQNMVEDQGCVAASAVGDFIFIGGISDKVGWIRVEDKTILSMGQRTVTHSPRFLVTLENAKSKNQSRSREEEEATSRLHIRQLREADRGCYMCQLNTKPMLSQLGCVDVLVPPDILSSGTSEGEVSVLEGENATLSCKASGRPSPRVLWRREKSGSILMRGLHDPLIPVDNQSGERLELTKVDRRQMGAYLCIAKNEVPPAVSKRVYLRVNFPPSVKVPNQLLSSPLDTDVSLICLIEAYPKTINLWTRKEQVIMSGGRYEIDERGHPDEEWKTTSELKIRRLEKTDLGEYTCSASSSMGKANATLRVHAPYVCTYVSICRRIVLRDRTSNLAHPDHLGKLEQAEQGEVEVCPSDDDQSDFASDEHAGHAEEHREDRLQQTRDHLDDGGPAGALHQRQKPVQEPRNAEREELCQREEAYRRVYAVLRALFALLSRPTVKKSPFATNVLYARVCT